MILIDSLADKDTLTEQNSATEVTKHMSVIMFDFNLSLTNTEIPPPSLFSLYEW